MTGTRLKAAVSNPSAKAEMIAGPAGNPEATLVRWDLHGAPAGSFALQFENGSGTVVAGLQRFVANVTVSEGRVVNVTYAPAPETDFWAEFNQERSRLNDLHANVAAAARLGVFRVEGGNPDARDQASRQLADKIRILKGIDPTLGIYAAYAYSDAALRNQVRSVNQIMRGNLGIDLFDIAMLVGDLTSKNLDTNTRLFPFCPMLSQGWNLLRVKDVRVAKDVSLARDHLLQSLWTTFDRVGMDILLGALTSGRLR